MEACYPFFLPWKVFCQFWNSSADVVSNNHIIWSAYTQICVLSAYTCDKACSRILVQLPRAKSLGIVFTYVVAFFFYRARYGVQLEKSTFERRTADFLWMMIFGAISLLVCVRVHPYNTLMIYGMMPFFFYWTSMFYKKCWLSLVRKQCILVISLWAFGIQALSAIPMLWTPFLGVSLVFMLLYVWSREFPTAQISIYGLVTLKVHSLKPISPKSTKNWVPSVLCLVMWFFLVFWITYMVCN